MIERLLLLCVLSWGIFNIGQSQLFFFIRNYIYEKANSTKDITIWDYLAYLSKCVTCQCTWWGLALSIADWLLGSNLLPFSQPKLFVFGMIFASGSATMAQAMMVKLWPEEFKPDEEDEDDPGPDGAPES